MKISIRRLQLDGKVVFVANQSFEAFAPSRDHHGWPVAVRGNSGRSDNFTAHSSRRCGRRVIGKIRAEKAALPSNQMAGRTSAFAEKDLFAMFFIAANNLHFAPALERAQISHESADLGCAERTKRRHAD